MLSAAVLLEEDDCVLWVDPDEALELLAEEVDCAAVLLELSELPLLAVLWVDPLLDEDAVETVLAVEAVLSVDSVETVLRVDVLCPTVEDDSLEISATLWLDGVLNVLDDAVETVDCELLLAVESVDRVLWLLLLGLETEELDAVEPVDNVD